jgi:hypothetical protein
MQTENYNFFLFNLFKLYRITNMRLFIIFSFLIFPWVLVSAHAVPVIGNADAASSMSSDSRNGSNAYNNLYHSYMNEETNSNIAYAPGGAIKKSAVSARSATAASKSANSAPSTAATRRVVSRSATSTARVGAAATSSSARRRVVARGTRADNSYTSNMASSSASTTTHPSVSAARCLSDYIDCMNEYCERDSMEYNRCYCSAKLAQIDARYKDNIQNLVNQIIALQYDGNYTDSEMKEYWENKISVYTGANNWDDLDAALDIDWASTESRVQGQETFLVGHEYCSQHLKGCYYMASNMRDAYISEISRDCTTYENRLDAVKTVAESVIENYSK